MPVARTTFLVASALTLALVASQFLLAGIGVFGAGSFTAHEAVGGILHGTALLMVLAAIVGRLGRRAIIASVGLLLLIGLQAGLANAPDAIAAFHPFVALVIFVGAAQTTMLAARARRGGPAAG